MENQALIQVSVEENETALALRYTTLSGREISSLVVEKSDMPKKDTPEYEVALVQLLMAPYGHINLLERWITFAASTQVTFTSDEDRKKFADLLTETKEILGIL